jgi:uncharacterized protein (TIGR02145 family)
MKKLFSYKTFYIGFICIISNSAFANSTVFLTNTYPDIIDVTQIVSTEKEIQRLRQIQKKFDHQVTGFYLPIGKQLVVNVEVITASEGNLLPKIVIGTPSRAGNTRIEISLVAGLNTISSSIHGGGMVYLRYVSNVDKPTGRARVSFSASSEHIRAPHFIFGVTSPAEFSSMMELYQTPDVIFSSDDAVVVVSRAAAIKYLLNGDKDFWMRTISNILLAEVKISGLSNDDPNPLHHRLASGIRHLFVEAGSGYMFATDFATGYFGDAALSRLLKPETLASNNWGVAHELGHQHQQGAYKPGTFTETTVNIYTLAVQRFFQGSGYIRSAQSVWTKLKTDYFSLPDATRDFNTESIAPVAGNVNESRVLLFDQLHIIFGDVFYQRLHRITREEQVSGGSDDERRAFFALKACQISGYDLRDYFYKWGYKLSAYDQSVVDKAVSDSNLLKPSCNDELHLVTPYYKPACIPLPLLGIQTSKPEADITVIDGVAAVRNYCDYSSKSGEFTDPRDNKKYAYKKYGNYDWFIQNLDWDGFDGLNESSSNTIGLYGSDDSDGVVFGRMYPTNASSSAYASWCPLGWTTPTTAMWDALAASIKSEYLITDSELVPCMKCGGDKDLQADGLWNKGAGSINVVKSALVGFNALPAGVFNKDVAKYDDSDKPGLKASFFVPNSAWYHKVLSNSTDAISYTNRNTRHHGSIRCVRPTIHSGVSTINDDKNCFVYLDDSYYAHIVSTTPDFFVKVYTITGKHIHTEDTNSSHLIINTTEWQKGIYVVVVSSNNKRETLKLIK